MQSPAAILIDKLQDRNCRVVRRGGDWFFVFGEDLSIATTVPWRIVTSEGIAHGSEDDGHSFGLGQPVDGEARTNELLDDQKVVGVELDALTADLQITFDRGVRIDLFNNSSGYEGWQAAIGGQFGLTVIALGGGKMASL